MAAQLIRDVGFEPVDTGPLRIARYLEPFTLAIAQLACEGDEGPKVRSDWKDDAVRLRLSDLAEGWLLGLDSNQQPSG